LQGLIDIQDANGDTALNIAARAESKLLVDQFIDAGASSQVSNNIGIKPEDYEEEDTVRNIVLVCN
jgi:ankyrin repeat protein